MTEYDWISSKDPQIMLRWVTGQRILSDRKKRLLSCACARHVWHLLVDERSRDAVETAEKYADGDTSVNISYHFNHAPVGPKPDGFFWTEVDLAWMSCYNSERHSCLESFFRLTHPKHIDKVGADLLRDIIGNPFKSVTFDPAWRTPTVLSLARAAYEERLKQKCGRCNGFGWYNEIGPNTFPFTCQHCHSTGYLELGHLDQMRLAILADALEDAGCNNSDILYHLRGRQWCHDCQGAGRKEIPHGGQSQDKEWFSCQTCRGIGQTILTSPHVRGCWALDLVRGVE